MDLVHCLPVHCFSFSSKQRFILEFEGKREDVFAGSLDEYFGGKIHFFPEKQTKVSGDMSSLLKVKHS